MKALIAVMVSSRPPRPIVYQDPGLFRDACDRARGRGDRVGLVPTMGALHDGHVALIREARQRAGFVAVSIFVNPTQFGPHEDFARYPRTLGTDVERCAEAGANCVFAPSRVSMYPDGETTRVRVGLLTEPLCGAFRQGHFEGVATIVAKLFALSGACVAVFGRKDYQQLKVIERMARDLLLPVDVVGLRTVRESDGLAMSSRNRYLSEGDRTRAAEIPRALGQAVKRFEAGERQAGVLRGGVERRLAPVADRIGYVQLVDADTLTAYSDDTRLPDRALLAVAVHVGPARLIDNVVLGEDPPPHEGDGCD